jgi:radical SAM superfamily enzyme YgiQ (UPF0313 family)
VFSVGIIVPTWHYFANPFKLQPLNELYFATVINSRFTDRDIEVSIIDLRQHRKEQNGFQIDKLISYVPEQDIYFYWIAKTADYLEILSIVQQLRCIYPKAKHAAGGTHVDNFPEECKKDFDAVVLGPGEESFINIVNDCRNKRLEKVYASDWKSVHYNNYPFARRHYLPESSVVNTVLFEKYGDLRGTSAMFSRGCNFKCSYCVYNVPNTIQTRSPKSIEEEIKYLKDTYHIEGVNLRDEICISLSPKVAIPYLEAIGRSNVMWRGQTRVGVSKEILTLARQTGCVELAVGVESISQQVLDIINKGQTVGQVREFLGICKSLDIKIKMCLIFGLPGEPSDIVDITRRFIEEMQPDYINISGFCPVPGSDIFKNRQSYGIRYIDEDWSKHAHLLYRFSDEEHFGLPFEYEETNRWGKAFSREEIIENTRELQHYAKERNISY